MKQFVLKIDEWSNLFWKLMNILITYRLDWGRTTTMKITSMHLVLILIRKFDSIVPKKLSVINSIIGEFQILRELLF